MYKIILFLVFLTHFSVFSQENNWVGLLDFKLKSENYEDISSMTMYLCEKEVLISKAQFVPQNYVFDYFLNQTTYYILYFNNSYENHHKDSMKNLKSITSSFDLRELKDKKNVISYISNKDFSCTKPNGFMLENITRYRSIVIKHNENKAIESSL